MLLNPARRALRLLPCLTILAFATAARAGGNGAVSPSADIPAAPVIDRLGYAVDGAESSYGADPRMWRSGSDGPQGPMQISAAAAADVGGGDRFDETQNRALGRAYLAHMYRRYASWPDAVAAYNWGPGRMDSWINGGRPPDKLPAPVERYRTRVLATAGLTAPPGSEPSLSPSNPRLARLELLRAEAKREMTARRRRGDHGDAVELLYTEIMRATAPPGR